MPSDLVGRDTELAVLAALTDVVAEGAGPRVAQVRGGPGSGRTALVRHAAGQAVARGFTVLLASADPAETAVPYGVVDQLLRRPGRRTHPASRTQRFDPGADVRAVARDLTAALDAEQVLGPVLLVVDDLEWADEESARALAWALPRAARVLVVLISGSDATVLSSPAVGALARVVADPVALELAELDVDAVHRWHTRATGQPTGLVQAQAVHRDAVGRPRHVHALLRERPDGGPPGTLVEEVLATRAALPRATRDLLDALSVLDGAAPLAMAGALAGLARPDLALPPACAVGLLSCPEMDTLRPDSAVTFVADGERAALYTGLSPTERARLHARAADLVSTQMTWPHRVATAITTDDGLAAELDGAAATAAAADRHDLATRYLRWAAELSGERATRDRRFELACLHEVLSSPWLLDDGRRERLEAMRPSARRSLALGLAASRDPGDRRGRDWLGEASSWAASWAGGPPADGGPGLAWVRGVADAGLARAHTLAGPDDEALTAARRALANPDLPVRLSDHARVHGAVARARIEGPRAALAELDALPPEPDPARLDVLGFRGALRMAVGDIGTARADLEAALFRRPNGTVLMPDVAPEPFLSQICYMEGEWDDALELTTPPTAVEDEHEHNRFPRTTCRITVLGGRGELEEAEALARELQEVLRATAQSPQRQLASIAVATVASYRGEMAGVLSALGWLRAVTAGDPTHTWWSHWWRPILIGALAATGETDEALAHIAAFREEARDAEFLRVVLAGHETLAATLVGDHERAVAVGDAYLGESGPVLFPHAHATFQHSHALRLLAVQRRGEAVALLQAAHATYVDLGSPRFVAAVVSDLERCGVGARRRARGVYGVLTHRETQVVELVLLDRLNREIADELHITVRTVEYHLRNVFGKLGVRTRAQLRRRAAGGRLS